MSSGAWFLTKVFFSVNEKEERKKYLLFDDDQSYFVFESMYDDTFLHTVWKNENFTHAKKFREIHYFVTSLVKRCFHEIFDKKV